MLAFRDDNEAEAVRKSIDCIFKNQDSLLEQSVILIEQLLWHYYSNIAVNLK